MNAVDERARGDDWLRLCEDAARSLPGVQFDWARRLGSTQVDQVRRARQRAPDWPSVLAAWEQVSGKGRLGRTWLSQPGQAVTLSVALPWPAASAGGAVTLACAVLVAETLRAEGIDAQIKWPNDILLGSKKLAGLLAEQVKDERGMGALVIGLGLNLQLPAQAMEATALAQARPMDGSVHEWADWNVRLAAALIQALEEVVQDGFAGFVSRFNALFAWRGQTVVVFDSQLGQVRCEGRAQGIDAQGRLLVLVGQRCERVQSGELSLRPARQVA